MEKSYNLWYEKISEPFKKRTKEIIFLNKALTLMTYIAYPSMLRIYFLKNRPEFAIMVKLIMVPAVSFAVLTCVRNKINRPRPYEQWDIERIIQKETEGHSMPSRHVFSMTCISMVFMYISLPTGIRFLIMAALLGFLRVVGGVHYPSDVIAGYIIGVLSGVLIFIL